VVVECWGGRVVGWRSVKEPEKAQAVRALSGKPWAESRECNERGGAPDQGR